MGWRDWTGVGERRWKKAPDEEVQPGKTVWDWLQLLIVPTVLVGIAFAWSAAQTKSNDQREDRRMAADRAAAEEVRRDATLQAYLNQMTGLILERGLLTSKRGNAVRSVARTVTLTTLRRLDEERKGEVVRFLHDAGLLLVPTPDAPGVVVRDPPVGLADADLAGVNLRADLSHTDLSFANLRDANLTGAPLGDSNLQGANLRDARFNHADLTGADLTNADLTSAKLTAANLTGADLGLANLAGANLANADLTGANLTGANLTGANLTGANLRLADLKGANLEDVKLTDAQRQQARNIPR